MLFCQVVFMKLYKKIIVGGQEYQPVSENISLDIERPGRAIFKVVCPGSEQDPEGPKGLVSFAMGWNYAETITLFFTGDIERCQRVDDKQILLFCRELSGRLDLPRPLALRHPTLKDVLSEYSKQTGLKFILPQRPYASVQIPAFYGTGTGFHGFSNLGAVFGIDDYMWQTQADGKIFVGSWQDSRWKDKQAQIPENFFKKVGATGFKSITAIPSLRPGAVVNGQRVVSLDFSGHEMRFKCDLE